MDKCSEHEPTKPPKAPFVSSVSTVSANNSKMEGVSWLERLKLAEQNQVPQPAKSTPVKRVHLPIKYEKPYLIFCFDAKAGYALLKPYTETEWFITELGEAREFLRSIYLRGIDTVILADNSLDLVPCAESKPSQGDWDLAGKYQHAIRAHLLGEPFNLFAPNSYKS